MQDILNKTNESLDNFNEYQIDGMLRSNFDIPKLSDSESDLLAMHKAQALLGLSYDAMPEIEKTICFRPHKPVAKSANEHNTDSLLENILDYASSIIAKPIVLDKSEKKQLLEQIVDLIEINIRKKERKNSSK